MSRTSVDRPSVVVPGQQLPADADEREASVAQEASAAVATEPEDDKKKAGQSVRSRPADRSRSAKPAARQPSRQAGSTAPGTLGAMPMIPLAAPLALGMPLAAATAPTAWADSVPYADPSLQALQKISGQFGTGTAVAPDRLSAPLSPDTDAAEPIRWGLTGANYQAQRGTRLQQADAMQNLDAELGGVLSDAVGMANGGRAKIDAIIADVNAALTALGPIRNTAEGQAMVHDAVSTALERAGIALENAQFAASAAAQEVSTLVDRYVDDFGEPVPVAPAAVQGVASGGPPGQMPAGEVGGWIEQALQVLAQNGHDISGINPSAVASIIAHESGGNPNAINLWDSNAAAGIPSKGLMQTIDPTFNAYAVPGHQDVWNPVDNIMAGIRYAEERYGGVDNVPGIVAMRSGGGYVGY